MIGAMWPTGYVFRGRETPEWATAPAGPAMTAVRSVIAYLASMIRCAGMVYIAVQVLIWHTFYTAGPWRLAAPALAVAWAGAITVRLRRRWPSPLLVGADSAFYAALALGAAGCVPPSVRDDAFSWLVIAMSGQLIVPAWYAPRALALPLILSSPLAYLAGAMLRPVSDPRGLAVATMMLPVVALLHSARRRAVYGRAAVADAALDEAGHAAGEQYAILSRTIERREHERLLHDTVLNTLTALARADRDDATEAVDRSRRDVLLIEEALGGRDDPAAGTGSARGDLLSQVRAVIADLRARGLAVGSDLAGPADVGEAAVPPQVTAAIANAVREALANVAAHAGTGEAWVTVRLLPRDGAARAPGRLEVTVRDQGRGFDLAGVPAGRLGLRRSITERTADCGGQASVWSAPGQGTVVRLLWPAPARPGETDAASRAPAERPLALETRPW